MLATLGYPSRSALIDAIVPADIRNKSKLDLGQFFELGLGVAASRQTAIQYYRQAAAQGYEPAKQRLAALGATAK